MHGVTAREGCRAENKGTEAHSSSLGENSWLPIPSVQLNTAHHPKASELQAQSCVLTSHWGIYSPNPKAVAKSSWVAKQVENPWRREGPPPAHPSPNHLQHFSHHLDPSSEAKRRGKLQGHHLRQVKRKSSSKTPPTPPDNAKGKIKAQILFKKRNFWVSTLRNIKY